jgi:hypothetical protein
MYKILLSITFLLNLCALVLGQSNACNTGTGNQIVVNGSCLTYNMGNNTVNDPTETNCGGGLNRDKWMWFQATSATTTVSFNNPTANRDSKVFIYHNTALNCGTKTYLTCNDNPGNGADENFSFATNPGDYYFVRTGCTNNNDLNGGTLCVTSVIPPPTNDNCGGAIALTAPSGVCTSTAGTTLGATLSQAASASCASTNPDDDVWFTFNAPAAGSYVVQVDGATSFDAVVEVFSGACGSLTSLGCRNATGNDGIEALNVTVPSSGIYRVRVYHNGVGSSATPTFNICVVTPPANDNCPGAIPVPLTGCGAPIAGTSLNGTQSQAGCSGTADDDVWYAITASATGTAQITVTPSGSYDPVVQVFAGTCGALTSLQCVNVNAIGVSEVVSLTGLTSGQAYYIRVYHQGTGSGGNTFTICATDIIPCTIGTGDVTVNGALLPYNSGATSTCGQINNITSSNVTNYCGSSYYYDGEDVVYDFITPSSGQITIDLTSGGSYTNLSIHEGCPSAGGSCIGSAQSSTGSKSVTICVTAGVRYYVVVDSWPSPDCNTYTLNISGVFGTGSSATNDQPCSATPMTLLVPASGNNACTGAANEPALPICWSSGNRNTVWYSIVAPASGQLRIKTIPSGSNPLQNTQFAVYQGVCGPGMTMIAGACNDDAPSCGGYSQFYSELLVTGLTAGNTYYIVVDGNGNSIGTFDVLAIDGTTNFAAVPGQDCFPALPVCNGIMTTGNPGYQAIGGTCDHTGSGNCTSGEANSVWYEFTMAADENVLFNIVPNDYGTPTNPLTGQSNPGYTGFGDETDYDWVLWKTSGSGSTTCAAILSSGGDGEQACNFDYLGVTGTSLDGNSPLAYPGFNAAYEVAPFGNTGDIYLLVIQNYSNSTSGFTLEFPIPSSINFAPSNSLYWSGGANTANWNTQQNWGGCATPDCGRDAFILNSSSFQPVLVAGSYNVRDVIINPGATLTLQSGATLNVCGNFTNNGNLICQPGSVVNFIGTGVQNITGSFVGTDAFHHFTVTKTSGSVFLVNDITVNGDLTTSNNTSILNTNNKFIRLGRHFVNSNGNNTFSNTGTTGTLEFIGNEMQNYSQGLTQLDLNHVVLNNSAGFGAGVTLSTNMFIKSATGTLTLTLGTITTGANRVDVANSAVGSVSAGNTASFVNGNLRRSVLGTGAYNWPVGNVSKGYQRALTTFASNANPYIDARFDSWPGGFPIQGGSDCATTFSMDAMNNGYWTLTGTGAAATYNMSLFPLNVTNAATGWTIMKQASYALTGWSLNGVCAASTVAQINRNNMTNFSVFGIAQSPTPLPIELLYFEGEIVGEDNLLTWATVSEQNNDYFTLERSRNGFDFEVLGTIAGAGTSTNTLHYNQFDYDPFAGTSYYRLKQTDFDGQYIYSQTIALNRGMQHAVLSDLFPNPANNSVNFMMNTPKSGTVNVEIYDNSGRLIASQLFEAHVGSNSFNIDISYFAKGIYSTIIRFEHLEKEEIKQLIKQ